MQNPKQTSRLVGGGRPAIGRRGADTLGGSMAVNMDLSSKALETPKDGSYLQYLPCASEYNGSAEVDKYFTFTVSEGDGENGEGEYTGVQCWRPGWAWWWWREGRAEHWHDSTSDIYHHTGMSHCCVLEAVPLSL